MKFNNPELEIAVAETEDQWIKELEKINQDIKQLEQIFRERRWTLREQIEISGDNGINIGPSLNTQNIVGHIYASWFAVVPTMAHQGDYKRCALLQAPANIRVAAAPLLPKLVRLLAEQNS